MVPFPMSEILQPKQRRNIGFRPMRKTGPNQRTNQDDHNPNQLANKSGADPLSLKGAIRHLAGEPLHDREGVIRFPPRRKISSTLIRNTVVPIAIRPALRSCLAIEASNHRQPGAVMSNIPL